MEILRDVLGSIMVSPGPWRANWAWGVPLIVLTVVIHVLSLGLINDRGIGLLSHMSERRHPTLVFVVAMGTTTLLATSLHAVEAAIWAFSYQFVGALPDYNSAMLYSLNAITCYGHENLVLGASWQLMGAIEALNGCLLFGLTTAFLFNMIHKIWLLSRSGRDAEAIPMGRHGAQVMPEATSNHEFAHKITSAPSLQHRPPIGGER
jgi:hypothetical protein